MRNFDNFNLIPFTIFLFIFCDLEISALFSMLKDLPACVGVVTGAVSFCGRSTALHTKKDRDVIRTRQMTCKVTESSTWTWLGPRSAKSS